MNTPKSFKPYQCGMSWFHFCATVFPWANGSLETTKETTYFLLRGLPESNFQVIWWHCIIVVLWNHNLLLNYHDEVGMFNFFKKAEGLVLIGARCTQRLIGTLEGNSQQLHTKCCPHHTVVTWVCLLANGPGLHSKMLQCVFALPTYVCALNC